MDTSHTLIELWVSLIEEAQYFAPSLLSSCLFMIQYPWRRGKHNIPGVASNRFTSHKWSTYHVLSMIEPMVISELQSITSGSSPKLSWWQQVTSPSLYFCQSHIKPWTDYTTLVETSIQEHHYLARSMIINNLKLTNVAWGKQGRAANTRLYTSYGMMHTGRLWTGNNLLHTRTHRASS